MTEQENNENRVLSFGEHLYVERKKQNLSVADVAKAIHLSEKVIDAVERSDIEQLPQPAFVKGYLKAYAKYLGISAAMVLEEYTQAVPHQQEADLQPRSTLAYEANSNSPLVKMITVLLLLLMIIAAVYASFSYYKNAIVVSDTELEQQASFSMSETDFVGQGDDVSSVLDEQSNVGLNVVEQEVIVVNEVDEVDEIDVIALSSDVVAKDEVYEPDEVTQNDVENKKPINQLTAKGDDHLELFASQMSWLEVDDANGENLYYSLLEEDQQVKLSGTAPFKVFLGDAPQVQIKINDVSVNIEKYIRSNNIAHFRISVDQQQVVFH